MFPVCSQTVLVQSGAGSSGRAFSTQLKLTTNKIWLLGPQIWDKLFLLEMTEAQLPSVRHQSHCWFNEDTILLMGICCSRTSDKSNPTPVDPPPPTDAAPASVSFSDPDEASWQNLNAI